MSATQTEGDMWMMDMSILLFVLLFLLEDEYPNMCGFSIYIPFPRELRALLWRWMHFL